jgi:hypothetical protein
MVLRRLKRAGPIAAVIALALALVPAASSGNYGDATGDNTGGAGDITGVTVSGDEATGQVVFRIAGNNIASSDTNVLFLDIDSDANPNSGNLTDDGSDYSFYVDNGSYDFEHWNGSDWVNTPNSTVRVLGGSGQIMISVNRSELGNTADFNFEVAAINVSVSGSGVVQAGIDSAPDDGAYNFSLDAGGPQINSVDVRTTPSAGPKAGKKFVVVPTALHLPSDGRMTPAMLSPDSFTCTAELGGKSLRGAGTGGCTFSIPKKKSRGRKLAVQLTVNYQGAAKVVPFTFKVT